MSIIRHLKTLFPIPQQWSEDGKQFAIRTEEAYRDYQITKENVKASLESLDEAVDERIVGGRISKAITGSASPQTVRLDLPVGYWYMIISLPGLNRVWVGVVICTTNNNVSVQQINDTTGITITTAESRLNIGFSYSSDSSIQVTAIPFRNNAMPKFH